MIPTIGVMIGGYIIMRCFDVLGRPKAGFSSESWRNWMLFTAVVVMIATALESLFLMLTSGRTPAP